MFVSLIARSSRCAVLFKQQSSKAVGVLLVRPFPIVNSLDTSSFVILLHFNCFDHVSSLLRYDDNGVDHNMLLSVHPRPKRFRHD